MASSTSWMEVLVKDLCNPDVVAAIAKRRIFDIKDKANLTPEIWEKFRGLIPSVHHTQPVDPNDLEARLRDCPPRLSEPPNLEDAIYPVEGYDTPVLSNEEYAEENKIEAKEAYDTLIRMGGRPTRPIRFNPHWKTVLFGGERCYEDFEENETLFHDGTARCPGPGRTLTETGFIMQHWGAERKQFEEELRRWRKFRNAQQWICEDRPDKAREDDTERQRYPQDPHLTASLKKLKDWKEFQAYFQRGIDRCKQEIERARRAVEAIQRNDPEVETKTHKGHGDEWWLRFIETQREWVAAEEKRLRWAKEQLPAVLSECSASLIGAPTSRHEMEERSEVEAKRVFHALVETGGRPTRRMRPVPDIQEREPTDEHLHVLCHWEGEWTQFEEELREWKKFLDYRQKKEADGWTEVQIEEQPSAESGTQVKLWKDYRAYQQLEVENAKLWVDFWQRQVEEFQQTANHCALQGNVDTVPRYRSLAAGTAQRYHSKAEEARAYVEEVRKQVGPAESRLEWVEEQLSALLAGHVISTTEVSTPDHLEDQVKLPKRASRSGQTTSRDLRSHRSGRSTPRSNQQPDKNKKRASANSWLGPIHSSRVSKASEIKAPHRQQQSKILTVHVDGQNQGPDTTISPRLPANVALPRSTRLSINEKRSGELEASLAVDLGRSALSPPIILRRSDRISKQKERMSTSTSSAVANSAVILQTDPLRHLSRSKPKGHLAHNKSDTRSGPKPRGISKRQESKFSRNKT